MRKLKGIKLFLILAVFLLALDITYAIDGVQLLPNCELNNYATGQRNWTWCNINISAMGNVSYVIIESNFSGIGKPENITIGGETSTIIFDYINNTPNGTYDNGINDFFRNYGFNQFNGTKSASGIPPQANKSLSWDDNKGFIVQVFSNSSSRYIILNASGLNASGDFSKGGLLPNKHFTIEAKIRQNSNAPIGSVITHYDVGANVPNRAWGLWVGTQFEFKVGTSDETNPDTTNCLGNSTGGNSTPIGEWFTVAGIYDGVNITGYMNGTQVCGRAKTGTVNIPRVSTDNIVVGGDYADAERANFDGQIGYIRLWNYTKPLRELNNSKNMRFGYDSKDNLTFWNMTNIVQGNYYFRFWINLSNGTLYNTSTINVNVNQSNGTPSILNTSPSITINTPSNNSQTHNATPFIDFSIGTFSPNFNFTFEIYMDKNNLPTTKINRSENFTSGNFTISSYTLNNVTVGSLNGTYFIMFNITDNASNNVIIFNTFNLTNNISNYNVTNVSITTLPLQIGDTATAHCNITSFTQEKNNQTLREIIWWLNGTQLTTNINSTILAGTNATNNANITASCRVNNGYGETAWTVFVNSSTATVGDTTPPAISSQTISTTTPITTDNVNISIKCTDAGNIQYARAELNVSGNTFSNITLTSLGSNIFADARTYSLGVHNVTNFYCADGSGNIARDLSNFTFTVSNPPSGGGGSPSGGGGGGGSIVPPQPQCKENEILVSNTCVNASLFNVTFRVIGLTNIQPIVFYRTCGGFQEWRQIVRTTKIIKSAEFDKKQLNTNITIIGSEALVIKKFRISGIAERIDMGYLKMIDQTQQVARVFIVLKIVSLCNPLTYIFIVVPTIIIIFRKKLRKLFKK